MFEWEYFPADQNENAVYPIINNSTLESSNPNTSTTATPENSTEEKLSTRAALRQRIQRLNHQHAQTKRSVCIATLPDHAIDMLQVNQYDIPNEMIQYKIALKSEYKDTVLGQFLLSKSQEMEHISPAMVQVLLLNEVVKLRQEVARMKNLLSTGFDG